MQGKQQEFSRRKIPFFASLQTKYALSYLAILTVVLMLLNTYPVIASQDLLFSSKRDALKSQASVMASALMELESPTADQVLRNQDCLLGRLGSGNGLGHAGGYFQCA